jgi:hypothetical protein
MHIHSPGVVANIRSADMNDARNILDKSSSKRRKTFDEESIAA